MTRRQKRTSLAAAVLAGTVAAGTLAAGTYRWFRSSNLPEASPAVPSVHGAAVAREPQGAAAGDARPHGAPLPRFVSPVSKPRPIPRVFNDMREDTELTLPAAYDAEKRDLSWAPVMETKLKERFTSERLAAVGIAKVALEEVECRESTCRLRFTFANPPPQEIEKASLSPDSHNALDLVVMRQGPFAMMTAGADKRDLEDGRTAMTILAAFSDREIDPEQYEQWVADSLVVYKGRMAARIAARQAAKASK